MQVQVPEAASLTGIAFGAHGRVPNAFLPNTGLKHYTSTGVSYYAIILHNKWFGTQPVDSTVQNNKGLPGFSQLGTFRYDKYCAFIYLFFIVSSQMCRTVYINSVH